MTNQYNIITPEQRTLSRIVADRYGIPFEEQTAGMRLDHLFRDFLPRMRGATKLHGEQVSAETSQGMAYGSLPPADFLANVPPEQMQLYRQRAVDEGIVPSYVSDQWNPFSGFHRQDYPIYQGIQGLPGVAGTESPKPVPPINYEEYSKLQGAPPPEPVNWQQRLQDWSVAGMSLAGRLGVPGLGTPEAKETYASYQEMRERDVPDPEPFNVRQALTPDVVETGDFRQDHLNRMKASFGELFRVPLTKLAGSPEMGGVETYSQAFGDPMKGMLTTKWEDVGPFNMFNFGIPGFYTEEVEKLRQHYLSQGYGPMESTSMAYRVARERGDIGGVKGFILEFMEPDILLPGVGFTKLGTKGFTQTAKYADEVSAAAARQFSEGMLEPGAKYGYQENLRKFLDDPKLTHRKVAADYQGELAGKLLPKEVLSPEGVPQHFFERPYVEPKASQMVDAIPDLPLTPSEKAQIKRITSETTAPLRGLTNIFKAPKVAPKSADEAAEYDQAIMDRLDALNTQSSIPGARAVRTEIDELTSEFGKYGYTADDPRRMTSLTTADDAASDLMSRFHSPWSPGISKWLNTIDQIPGNTAGELSGVTRGLSTAARAARIVVPDSPELYGKPVTEMLQPSGVPIPGSPISLDDAKIPETLYHVSPNKSLSNTAGTIRSYGGDWEGLYGGAPYESVSRFGRTRTVPTGLRGAELVDLSRRRTTLGGDPRDEGISFITDKEVAEQLVKDFKLVQEISGFRQRNIGRMGGTMNFPESGLTLPMNTRTVAAQILSRLVRLSAREGWDETVQGKQLTKMHADVLSGKTTIPMGRNAPPRDDRYWLNQYFALREAATGARNPVKTLQLESLQGWNAPDPGIIEVSRNALRTGAMVTDIDIGLGGLDELRIYGDVPLRGRPVPDAPPAISTGDRGLGDAGVDLTTPAPRTVNVVDDVANLADETPDETINRVADGYPTEAEAKNTDLMTEVEVKVDEGDNFLAAKTVKDEAISDAADKKLPDPNNIDQIKKNRGAVANWFNERFPNLAARTMLWKLRINDGTGLARELSDGILKQNPNAWNMGEVGKDVLSHLMLNQGQIPRAFFRYENFMRNKIKNLTGVKQGDVDGLVKGMDVEEMHIERYVQHLHWLDVVAKHPTRKDSMPIPRDVQVIDGEITTVDVPGWNKETGLADVIEQWKRDLGNHDAGSGLPLSERSSKWARVELGAKAIADEYAIDRARLVKSGWISARDAKLLAESYPHYNPTIFAENVYTHKIQGTGKDSMFWSLIPPVKAIKEKVSEEAMEKLGALGPLSPEVMLKHFTQTEYRIQRNESSKAIYNMIEVAEQADGKPLGWLKEVTKQYEKPHTRTVNKLDKDGNVIIGKDGKPTKVVEKWIERLPIPPETWDLQNKKGYLIFWDDGKRRIFGGQFTKDGYLPHDVFEMLYGRGGMGARRDGDTRAWLAFAGGLKRQMMTSFSPKFMVANAVLDAFAVWVRYGIFPYSIFKRMARETFASDGVVRNADSNLYSAYQAAGADRARTGNIAKKMNDLQNQIFEEGLHGEVIYFEGIGQGKEINKSRKMLQKMNQVLEEKFILARGSKAIEQAPRLEVFERILRKELGDVAWEKLARLDSEDFMQKLLYEYEGGEGLINHPALRKAGMASLDSTLNFWRGGEWIRNINPFTYFLNASMEGMKLPFRTLGINIHPTIKPLSADEINLRKANNTWQGEMYEFGEYNWRMGATGKMFSDIDIRRRYPGLAKGEQTPEEIRKLMTDAEIVEDNILSAIENTTSTAEFKGMGKSALMRLGGVATAQMGLMAWNLSHADEWGYWDIPTWVKYSGFLLLLPPRRDENGEVEMQDNGRVKPNFMLMPHRTREWTIFSGTPVYMMEKAFEMMAEDGMERTDIWKYGKILMSNWSPVDTMDINPMQMIPWVDVAYEDIIEGKDLWKDRDIVTPELQGLDPELQYTTNTSPTMIELSKIFSGAKIGEFEAGSPERMHHLYNNIFASAGEAVLDFPDYVIRGVDLLKRSDNYGEHDTPEAQVNYFRSLKSRGERDAYRANIARQGPEVLQSFENQLRKPRETWSNLPVIKSILERYLPDTDGGVGELARGLQDRALSDLGMDSNEARKLTRKVKIELSEMRTKHYNVQLEDDKELQAFTNKTVGEVNVGLSPVEWKKARNERRFAYQEYREITINKTENQGSIYNLSEGERQSHYQKIYEVIGKITDDPDTIVELLLTSYYGIMYPNEEDPVRQAAAEYEYYRLIDEFRENIENTHSAAINQKFNEQLTKNKTQMEVIYDRARRVMAPYWEIGRDADSFIPTASPEQKRHWNAYQRGTSETKRKMREESQLIKMFLRRQAQLREQYVMSTIDANGRSDLDLLLAYWSNPNAYDPVTRQAMSQQNRWYGVKRRLDLPQFPKANPLNVGPLEQSTQGGRPPPLSVPTFR